jgi:hypothetical protein
LGDRGVVSPETARRLLRGPGLNLLDVLPPGDGSLVALFAVTMAAAVGVTIGCFTRTSAVVLFLGLVSLQHRDTLILNGGDQVMRLAGFFLILSPAGAALSVDRLRRVRRGLEAAGPPPWVAPWAQRLIQLQLAAVYLMSTIAKLQGVSWRNGTAVYIASRLDDFWRLPVPYVFEHLWTIQLATWGTIVVEGALALLVWLPPCRYPALLGGVALHAGIEWAMNIPLFSARMVTAYVLFVRPDHLDRAMAWVRSISPRPGEGPPRSAPRAPGPGAGR